MDSIVDTFSHLCLEKFHFLATDFACRSVVKKERSGDCRVIYRNGTTAVEIGLEWREQYIYVELYRLVNGKMEENPIMIRHESHLTVFNLEDLIAIRAPELQLNSESPGRPLTSNDVEEIVTERALALRDYGRDVLQGDFRVFRELDRVVKNRVLAHQPSDRSVVPGAKGALLTRVNKKPDERDNLRLQLLAYGLEHVNLVVSLEEIVRAIPQVSRDALRNVLEHFAEEGLVTKASDRYSFNKIIRAEMRYNIERLVKPSRTIRKREQN